MKFGDDLRAYLQEGATFREEGRAFGRLAIERILRELPANHSPADLDDAIRELGERVSRCGAALAAGISAAASDAWIAGFGEAVGERLAAT
jgi:hypothetical protein